MNKVPCRILLTSVGGLSSPLMIQRLRESHFLSPTIIGVDMSGSALGRKFLDGFSTVPRGDSPEYATVVADICRQNGVDFVVPCSDAEVISLSAAAPAFRAQGVHILCSSHESTVVASNKYLFLTRLKTAGFPVPRHYVPKNTEELHEALSHLGHPERDVVVKPLSSCGSRGVRILRSQFNELEHIFGSKQETFISYDRLLRLLTQSSQFPELLFMEHLSGGVYNVDVLCDKGRCVHIVPQRKLPPEHGSVRNCLLDYSDEVEDLTRRIVEIFAFDHLVNLEFAFTPFERGGKCLVFEANVRASATITMTHASGCYLLEEALCRSLGIDTNRSAGKVASIMRYWSECYE